VLRYWHGYLSGVRCKLFAYGPADATTAPIISCSGKIQNGYLSGAGLPRLRRKKGHYTDVVVVLVVVVVVTHQVFGTVLHCFCYYWQNCLHLKALAFKLLIGQF